MSLVEIHDRLGNTAMLYCLILSLWGFLRYFRGKGLEGSFWGALAIAELLLLIQGGMGAYLWLIGLRPARTIHILYGIVGVLGIPMVFAFTKGRDQRPEMLMHAVTLLFLFGILLRALTTG